MAQQLAIAGEEYSGGRTVVVGVKLDSQSKELLTWALIKVVQPGDRVIALHVLGKNEIVNRNGQSSLLSVVKAFDSVLAVYDGYCNLKQVDLKLKICRGSPIRKILVREAKSYCASEVILGTASKQHTIRSSASAAKYCAKKLAKECSVSAVSNGKIVFQGGFYSSPTANIRIKGTEDHSRNGLLGAIQMSLSKNPKALDDVNEAKSIAAGDKLELASAKTNTDCSVTLKQNCSMYSSASALLKNSHSQSRDEPSRDGDQDKFMAIVPVQKLEAASSSFSLLIRELPKLRSGWPLLHRAILSNGKASNNVSVRQIYVVEWAMQLPSRHGLAIENSDSRKNSCDQDKGQSSELDGESGAIVPVGNEIASTSSSPDCKSRNLQKELEGLHEKYSATCRLFQYQELLSATSNFKPDNMIGKGGNSQVYRGCLSDGKVVAVKVLKPSQDVLKEFVLEIEIVTALDHKNVISLFGFCFEDNNLLLVYDFLSRGSLEENLHGHKKDPLVFGWNERYKVAVGVAKALYYLHSKSEHSVIHRDVKSSNILLSDDFEPQLSDFGLAKWASTSSSHITCTDVAGTFGYLAPEYFMYGKVNDKIDVYAFGVVLLELLSGRKPISSDHPKGQESLVLWANPFLNGGKFSQVLDPTLGSDYDQNQVERIILAATLCIRRAPRARPHMSTVLKLLQGYIEVIKWARLEVDASQVSDATVQLDAVEGSDGLADEALAYANLKSHLNLALLDVEEESLSISSIEQSISLEDYMRGRWSRSSSFD